jgi:hypothetical protein
MDNLGYKNGGRGVFRLKVRRVLILLENKKGKFE